MYLKKTLIGLVLGLELLTGCARQYFYYFPERKLDREIVQICLDEVTVYYLTKDNKWKKYSNNEWRKTQAKVYKQADKNKDNIITKEEAAELFEKVFEN